MKALYLAVALTLPALAAVDGLVTNATTGKPQAGAKVTLIELGSGMKTLASTKSDAEGKFHFDTTLGAAVPYLVQALYQDVTYNQVLRPGAPSSGITVQVYNAAAKAPDAKVSQHMVLLEPSTTELSVSETFIFENSGTVTFNAPDGTLRFYLPRTVTSPVRVTVQAPQGMPIQRQAERSKEPDTWVVKVPIKPGETRIDLSYAVPGANPVTFQSKLLQPGAQVRIVAPKGVSLEGAAVRNVGTHPQTQATIYEVDGNEYSVTVQGTGTLRPPAASSPSGESGTDESSPGIEESKPLIYRRLPWIVALAISMLGVGIALLYRSSPPPPEPALLKSGR